MASGAAGEADGKASGPSQASNWSTEETKAVIAIWADEDTQTATDDPFTRNKQIYAEIAKQLTAMGYKRNELPILSPLRTLSIARINASMSAAMMETVVLASTIHVQCTCKARQRALTAVHGQSARHKRK